jgi:hypothetical protein
MPVKLAALRTGRPLFPRNIFFCFKYSFLLETEQTPEPIEGGTIRQIDKIVHLMGSRTSDLPACSIVLQPISCIIIIIIIIANDGKYYTDT